MKTLIKNGTVITGEETRQADVLIENEKVIRVGTNIIDPDADLINAEGKLVMPGGVDAHVHLELPMFDTISSDDYYTGGKAAAFGGTTTMIDFVSHDEGSLHDNISRLLDKAAPKASIDFALHMNITRFDETILRQLETLPAEGITSIKVFTAYNNRLRLADQGIDKVMQVSRSYGLLTMLHAEDGDEIETMVREVTAQGHTEPIWHAITRPASGTVRAFRRIIELSAKNDAPLFLVHMNVAGEVDELSRARIEGIKVMGETCPQYLFFTEDDLKRPDGAKWICSPPVRKKEDNERLMRALSSSEIQVISTDHCPFFYGGTKPIKYENEFVRIPGKELGKNDFTKIPNGLPGIADRMPVLWTYGVGKGHLTPNQFVNLMCTNPARIFGLYPQKGTIAVGSDADIVMWDPGKQVNYGVKIAHHRTDYNLYEGWQLKGYPEKVFLRGKLLVDHEKWLGEPGSGKYQTCKKGEIL